MKLIESFMGAECIFILPQILLRYDSCDSICTGGKEDEDHCNRSDYTFVV